MHRPNGEPRYRLLETVREYALEWQAEVGELPNIRQPHAEYFLQLAEDVDSRLTGPQQAMWFERLETDHDNVRAALRWATDSRETGLLLRLAAAMARLWSTRGFLIEGRAWLEAARAQRGP